MSEQTKIKNENENDRNPVLSDLKDCGVLEPDADLVWFTCKTPTPHPA